MASSDPDWSVLVPIEILKGETVSESIPAFLSRLPVVILGYHELPEQTPPGQAQLQYEDQAQSQLDDLAAVFTDAGCRTETRLVFTHDREQTIDRIAHETESEAFLIPNPVRSIDHLLVPVRGEVNVERVARFVAKLVGDRDIKITLYHVTKDEAAVADGEAMLEAATAELTDSGIIASNITRSIEVSDQPIEAIIEQALEHDTVIMGESEPSLRSFLFGDISEQIAAESLGPVIVVRKPRETKVPDEGQ